MSGRQTSLLWCCTAIALLAQSATARADPCCPDCVIVALDLDPGRPGFQTQLEIAPGTRRVTGVTIWILDPAGAAPLHSIGFVGGLNRGIALGHAPGAAATHGRVERITATQLSPVVPGNVAFVDGGTERLFDGPEVQYFEVGAFGSAPGTIPAQPAHPVMTLDVELADASAGDVFLLHLGDKTAQWISGQSAAAGGAFSSGDLNTLESGGDACPDGTPTVGGVDADSAAPVPPARFRVDYQDGGGARIRVAPAVPALPGGTAAALALLLAACGAGAAVWRARG